MRLKEERDQIETDWFYGSSGSFGLKPRIIHWTWTWDLGRRRKRKEFKGADFYPVSHLSGHLLVHSSVKRTFWHKDHIIAIWPHPTPKIWLFDLIITKHPENENPDPIFCQIDILPDWYQSAGPIYMCVCVCIYIYIGQFPWNWQAHVNRAGT